MRTPEAEERFLRRRSRATNRVLDLTAVQNHQLDAITFAALMVLAHDMPAILELVLDQAEALTPPRQVAS